MQMSHNEFSCYSNPKFDEIYHPFTCHLFTHKRIHTHIVIGPKPTYSILVEKFISYKSEHIWSEHHLKLLKKKGCQMLWHYLLLWNKWVASWIGSQLYVTHCGDSSSNTFLGRLEVWKSPVSMCHHRFI